MGETQSQITFRDTEVNPQIYCARYNKINNGEGHKSSPKIILKLFYDSMHSNKKIPVEVCTKLQNMVITFIWKNKGQTITKIILKNHTSCLSAIKT